MMVTTLLCGRSSSLVYDGIALLWGTDALHGCANSFASNGRILSLGALLMVTVTRGRWRTRL